MVQILSIISKPYAKAAATYWGTMMQFFGRTNWMPLLASALCLFLSSSIVQAEAVAADQAMIMLSTSQAVDNKCKFLSSAEHDELLSLVARAELALAARASVQMASFALAKGRAIGQAASCSDSERANLSTVMTAARTAVAQIPVQKLAEPQMPATLVTKNAPTKKVAAIIKIKPLQPPPKSVVLKKPVSPNPAALAQYATVTQKYYLARRCGSMSAQGITALYKEVVAIHRSSIENFGKAPVAATMRHAESKANLQSCS